MFSISSGDLKISQKDHHLIFFFFFSPSFLFPLLLQLLRCLLKMTTGGDVQWLEGVLLGAVEWSATVPGLSWVVNYVAHSLHRDPWRLFLEILMVAVLLRYLFGRRYRPKDKGVKFTKNEVEDLVHEWEPEPLVPPLSHRAKREAESIPVIEGPSGVVVKIGGQEKINLASYNFLGLVGDERIEVTTLPFLPLFKLS